MAKLVRCAPRVSPLFFLIAVTGDSADPRIQMKSVWLIFIFLLSITHLRAESLVYEGVEGIGRGKHIVFIANDHEYRSEQTCPLIAKIMAKHFGFRCTVLFGIDEEGALKQERKASQEWQPLRTPIFSFSSPAS